MGRFEARLDARKLLDTRSVALVCSMCTSSEKYMAIAELRLTQDSLCSAHLGYWLASRTDFFSLIQLTTAFA